MNPIELSHALEKYIRVLILSKHPEIEDVEVVRGPEKQWSFNKADWIPTIEITFYTDGTDQEFENELRDEIETMKTFFSANKDVSVRFRIITEDDEIGRWFV